MGNEHEYALVRLGGRLQVVATELAAKVAALEGHEAEVLGTARGAALVGLAYRHPFIEREGLIAAGEHVTLEDGTGLVHTAPGHGVEDFQLGQREGLPIYCPVRGDGRYDDTVPEWLRGVLVFEANPKVIERLRESGHLYHHHDFVHSYPIDWRSKTPVIFRCTEQWFIAVDKPTVRDQEIAAPAGPRGERAEDRLRARLGQEPPARHARGAARLVHLAPALLGPAHPGLPPGRRPSAC